MDASENGISRLFYVLRLSRCPVTTLNTADHVGSSIIQGGAKIT